MQTVIMEHGLWLIIPILLMSIMGLFLGIGSVYIVKRLRQNRTSQKEAVFKVSATIIDKRIEKKVKSKAGAPQGLETQIVFLVNFQLGTGETIIFEVLEHEYHLLQEGDCGTLIYQNKSYKSFQKDLSVIEK